MQMTSWEVKACRLFNALNGRRGWGAFFATVSRLGDGVFWYTLIGSLAIFGGAAGALAAVEMLVCGLLALVCYKALKHGIARPRPCETSPHLLRCTVAPLDRWSFPSGHTMHAVCFTILAVDFAPPLSLVLAPFATLVACSRLVLGLHYPSDVVAGAGIGGTIALCGIAL